MFWVGGRFWGELTEGGKGGEKRKKREDGREG